MSPSRVPFSVPRSPGGRRRFLSENFAFRRQEKVFRCTGERGTSTSELFESPVRTPLGLDKTTQWDSNDSKSSGSSFLSGTDTSVRSTQTPCGKKGLVNFKSQTLDPIVTDVGIQAFHQEPFANMLSPEEVCDLVQVERFIGLGMKNSPKATFVEHSISSKRTLSDGIVYQVIIVKELYEKEQGKVNSCDCSEKVTVEMATNTEDANDEIIVIEDDSEGEELQIVKVKETKVKKEKEDQEEINLFKEKPWVNLRNKIVGKQKNQVPEPVGDTRTPYQKRTESPAEPNPCLFELNEHIQQAMLEIDAFLANKPKETQAFLPLTLNKKVSDQYNTTVKPNFDLDPELATQLEGLLSGVAFSGLGKKGAPFSSSDLGRLGQVSFNLLEIISFLMAAIAIMDEGLAEVEQHCKGKALSILKEHQPFLGSMDKACRHLVKDTLALMSTFMVRQRNILGSTFAVGIPNTYRNRILKAPLSHFDVTPKQIILSIKSECETFMHSRAFSTAVARLGNIPTFRGPKKSNKKRSQASQRGNRGQVAHFYGPSSARGGSRGSFRGVKRSGFNKNFRGFERRDRALKGLVAPRGAGNSSTGTSNAGSSQQ